MSESDGTLMGPPEKRASAMPDSLPERAAAVVCRLSCTLWLCTPQSGGRAAERGHRRRAPVGADSGLWHVPCY